MSDDYIVSFPELGVEAERTFQGFWKFKYWSVACKLHPDETGKLWEICLAKGRREFNCQTVGELRDAVEFALEKAEQFNQEVERDIAKEKASARKERAERERRKREGRLPAREICVDGIIIHEVDPHIDSVRDIWEFCLMQGDRGFWFRAVRDRGEKEWAVRPTGDDDYRYEWADVSEDEFEERPRDFRDMISAARIYVKELIEDEEARERGEYSPEDELFDAGDYDDDDDLEDQSVLEDEGKLSEEDLYNKAELDEMG